MSELRTYAVYLHEQALEVLGEPIKGYLTEGTAGQHLICREIDVSGSFCEMTLVRHNPNGKSLEMEVMIPNGMVRLVVSISGGEIDFGFG